VRRIAVLLVALMFISGFAFLTVAAIAHEGFTAASGLSIIILLVLGVGIVGALRDPPA
jgi:hypothetical protein